MKPTMFLTMRIAVDSTQKQKYSEDEIKVNFLSDDVTIERKLVIRKSDGAVMGEVLIDFKTDDIIKNYNNVNNLRNELNNKIKEHYEPLLSTAGFNKDYSEFLRIASEIPDCPFLLTCYRMEEMYFKNELLKD